MAKVLKGHESVGDRVVHVHRESLEEFPEEEIPEPEEAGAEEVEEEIDPEEIRAAILEEARQEAEAKVQEAYKEGYQRGETAGRTAFEESIAQCASALEAAAQEIQQAQVAFLDTLEPQVIELVRLIAAQVLAREVQEDGEMVLSMVRRALKKLASQQVLRVRVHPADLEALRTHKVTLLEEFDGIERLSIDADESVPPGGCQVDSDFLQVNASIELLLQQVLDEMITG